MLWKDLMIPITVPNNPINGALTPTVPSTQIPPLSASTSSKRRSSTTSARYSSDSPSCWEMTSRNTRPAGVFWCCWAAAKAAVKSPFCKCPTKAPATRRVPETRPRNAQRRSQMIVMVIIDITIKGYVTYAP